jgi:hypothetical protein
MMVLIARSARSLIDKGAVTLYKGAWQKTGVLVVFSW